MTDMAPVSAPSLGALTAENQGQDRVLATTLRIAQIIPRVIDNPLP
ncbi:hypothetical protein [Streptomyces milbemycinicus]|uniref:Uncharacterized protein n=1 Tax=Streptomyces milbemycinicus TaxID=476552 RepID=A0ABW8LR48_9ACTN